MHIYRGKSGRIDRDIVISENLCISTFWRDINVIVTVTRTVVNKQKDSNCYLVILFILYI